MLYTNLIQKHWHLNKVSKKNKNRRAETATALSAPITQKQRFPTASHESNSDSSNCPIAHQHLRATSQRQSDKTNREITFRHPCHFIGEQLKINS